MPTKPHIAILMEFPTALGGERSLLSILELLKDKYEITLLAPSQGPLADLIKSAEVKHLRFSVRNSQGIRKSDEELLSELHLLLHAGDFQIVHANSVSLARFLGRHRDRFPQTVTAHLRDIMKLSARAIRDVSSLDRLIAVSRATAESYQLQGVPKENVQVIYNGIDSDAFVPTQNLDLHRELDLPKSVRFAATIGQIGLRKGHDVLVEAIPSLAAVHPDWHFLIVGQRYSTKKESREFVDQMLDTLDQNGNASRVHWLGYRTDVAEILEQADLLIHPARQEPFGRVLLEAAAMGKAILASDVGGTSEMLVHQESAWLVKPNDVDSLREACLLLMGDEKLRDQLGHQAQVRIAHEFTITESARELALLWDDFL